MKSIVPVINNVPDGALSVPPNNSRSLKCAPSGTVSEPDATLNSPDPIVIV